MARGEHTNSFQKGMTSDISLLYQPDGTYRYMKNCQLISQDGNNYSIKDCLGNTLIFELNIPYYSYVAGTPAVTVLEDLPMAITFISFPGKLVVMHTNSKVDGGGYGEIGVLNYVPYGQGISPLPVAGNGNNGYVPIYGHVDLKFSQMHKIEGFAYEENDEIQRVYWTDNNNNPRALNVGDPMFTTYIASGSLVTGQQYMVVEGIISHNAVYYAPTNGAHASIASNVFTAVNANYTDITAGSPTAKVIEYYPVELLDWTPDRSLGTIKFKNYGVGSVYCGSKIYFYRLSKPSEGIYTSWSYGSSPIHVGTENDVTAAPANPFFDFTGGGNSTTLLSSDRSVVITIDNIDQNYDNIEVAVAEFDQSLETIRAISIIENIAITGTSMDITHSGGSNLGELTLSDITLFPASILKCKTVTTNKNYILVGNTEERSEFDDFGTANVVISQIQHKIRAHQSEYGVSGSLQVCENIFNYNISGSVSNVTPDAGGTAGDNPPLVGGIQPYTEWIVTAGIATYNGVQYGPSLVTTGAGQYFRGVPGTYDWANTSGTAIVSPAVFRNKYTTDATATPSNTNRPDGIQFNVADSDQWNYKNPAVESWKKGYWSNQTYRFGILFYDLKGNPYYVRWLDDFTFNTTVNVPLMELIQVNAGGDDDWYLNQNGISIDGIEVPASIIDKIKGFSIVRAERDATIMTQGMLMQVGSNLAGTINVNLAGPGMSTDAGPGYITSNVNLFTYICPDKLVSYPVENYVAGSNLEISHWVVPRNVFGAAPPTWMVASPDASGPIGAVETKYFEVAPAETTPDPDPTREIVAIAEIPEGDSISNFGSTNTAYVNQQGFGVATSGINTGCNGAITLTNTGSMGGPRTLINVDGTLWGYNTYNAIQYGNLGAGSVFKLIANVSVSKSNLYGGQSPEALANTFYISTGHFQPITAAVKADTFDGVDKYIFNNVEIWGGDCYNALITYGHSLYRFGGSLIPLVGGGSHSWGIKFACQCNSNYDLRRGRLVEANRMFPAATGVVFNDGATPPAVRLEGFSYNKGYSSTGLPFLYPALPVNFLTSGQFKFRIRYAGEKFPGETIDSFRVFNTNDYKDTDGKGGEINNLKTKDGRTVVWQNAIVSTVPILERQVMSGAAGEDTTIGTGGVVDRFDPISSAYGNQHQWSVTETEYGFFWFDMRKKACVVLNFGEGIQEVSQVEGLKAFFDEAFLEVLDNSANSSDVLNSPTFDATSDRPLLGVGIIGGYDPKFKMTYATFKYYSRADLGSGKVSNLAKDFTIGYYHPAKIFVGFFDWTPSNIHTHNQTMFSVKNPQNKTKYYGANMASTSFVVGDIVNGEDNREYICILPLTIASYPGGPTQVPDYPTSVYWVRINQTNEIWAHNQPIAVFQNPAPDYEYSKFFGQVVDFEVSVIVNPKSQNSFSVLNIEQHGNDENATDIYIENDYESAEDTSITSDDNYYRWIYNAWCSSLPLDSDGVRLTGDYLQVTIYKKNWDTVPYTRTRNPKILEQVKSFFEEKR